MCLGKHQKFLLRILLMSLSRGKSLSPEEERGVGTLIDIWAAIQL